MKKWSYKGIESCDFEGLAEKLNALGKEGWECVNFIRQSPVVGIFFRAVMKREIPDPTAEPEDDDSGTKIVPRGETEEYL